MYEDNHLIAVNKRASDLSQGDTTGDESLDVIIKRYLAEKYNKPGDVFLGVVHRLDRPVSGVMLYARTSKALARMNEIFRSRKLKKIYWAIVSRKPPQQEGRLVNYLLKNEKQNKSYVFTEPVQGARRAELTYRLAGSSDRYYLLEIELYTGRHHQIRAQLAAAGFPVKGDLKYGANRSNPDGSICLHAKSIRFIHPVKKNEILITAPLPGSDIWKLFADPEKWTGR